MDNIKVLEEIGLKKVSEETHIEQKYIKYMVDCKFEKLNRINTLGFVKILSRAYNIDLDAWNEAFEEYWTEAHKNDEDKGLFIVVDDNQKGRKLLIFLLLVVVISTAGFLFALFQDKINLDNYIEQEETSFEQSSIVEDAQKTLDEINTSVVKEKIEDEININVDEETIVEDINKIEDLELVDNNETNLVKSDEPIVEENNETTSEIVKTEKIEKVSPRFDEEAIINPNTELWVGVIYLDTKKRRSYLGEGNFSIDISRDQIITTGHGSLNIIQENGEILKFNKQAPLRFLVKDNNISEINWSKFKELNEGKSW